MKIRNYIDPRAQISTSGNGKTSNDICYKPSSKKVILSIKVFVPKRFRAYAANF